MLSTLSPLARAGAQSSGIMTTADIGTQIFVEGKNFDSDYSLERSLRWTLAGFVLHGPYFFLGYSMLDKRFGAMATLRGVAMKTAAVQFLLFPPYFVAIFGLMGVLEKHPDIMGKIQSTVPSTFASSCCFWPVINGVTFTFVSPSLRLPFVVVSSGFWNSYLSWFNASDSKSSG